MQRLPETIRRNGMIMRQMKRTDTVAMYELLFHPEENHPGQKVIGYEVFKIIKTEDQEVTLGGRKVQYKAKEMAPSKEAFGRLGFAFGAHPGSLERAEERYIKMNEETFSESLEGIEIEDDIDIDLDLDL